MRSEVAAALDVYRKHHDATEEERRRRPAAGVLLVVPAAMELAGEYVRENDPEPVDAAFLGLPHDNAHRYYAGAHGEKVSVYLGHSSDGSTRWCAVVDHQPYSTAIRVETRGKLRTFLRLLGVSDADIP